LRYTFYDEEREGLTSMKKMTLILAIIYGIIFSAAAYAQDVEMQDMPIIDDIEITDIIGGKVTAVDIANSILTVTDDIGETYSILATKEETSIWKGDDTIDITGIEIGDSVELEYYTNADAKLVAIWVDILLRGEMLPPEVAPAKENPAVE